MREEELTKIIALFKKRQTLLLKSPFLKEKREDYKKYLLKGIKEEENYLKKRGGKLLEKEKLFFKDLKRKELLLEVFGDSLVFK